MIPEQIGQYAIERKIGSGGMGTVYLGRHRQTDRVAAVKVLPASLAREEGFVLRFTREVDAMKSLSNPHVVEVYESGVENDTYYYAMEYVEGETLSQRLRQSGRIPWREVIEYSVQICSALKAAHDAGIIHRDLKPSNLLITPAGQVKLLDFGVAQVFASGKLTKTGGIIGTAEYMSPEQAQGRRATKKSDLYSLGAVMYAMLTARPPFSGKTSMEVIQKHKFGLFDRPRTYVPEIPHWLDDVVCQCLDKDPDKRFPDAYVLSLRLKEILKKVDLSQEDKTSVSGTLDGTAETIVSGDDPNAIGGTLMRDLMKAELNRNEQVTTLHQVLDNTWVLLGLFVLLLLGGLWWFRNNNPTPAQQFAKGKELFEQGPLYWSQARSDYFLPLLESDAERWSEQIEPLLMQIEVQELKQDFGLTRLSARRVNKMSDAHRFLHMAREYYKLGDTVRGADSATACRTAAGTARVRHLADSGT
ncbi:MAG: serine/threonine-protein kinase [Planctomycetaceae bacterium]